QPQATHPAAVRIDPRALLQPPAGGGSRAPAGTLRCRNPDLRSIRLTAARRRSRGTPQGAGIARPDAVVGRPGVVLPRAARRAVGGVQGADRLDSPGP